MLRWLVDRDDDATLAALDDLVQMIAVKTLELADRIHCVERVRRQVWSRPVHRHITGFVGDFRVVANRGRRDVREWSDRCVSRSGGTAPRGGGACR